MLRTVLHHLLQELDDHLRRRAHEHLALAALLGVVDGAEAVVEHGNAHHDSCVRGSSRHSGAQNLGRDSRGPGQHDAGQEHEAAKRGEEANAPSIFQYISYYLFHIL